MPSPTVAQAVLAPAVLAPAAALAGGLRGLGVGVRDLLHGDGSKRQLAHLREMGRGGQSATVRSADGIDLHLEYDGPSDAPATVVFVHGYSLDVTNWRSQRPVLATSGLRCVYYDQRGFGRSPRGDEPASMRLLAADLGRVIEAQPAGPVVLVGHSMGVMVIAALAGIRPGLFGDRVAGTVLIAGNAAEITTSEFGLGGVVGPLLQRVGLGGMRTLARIPHVEDAATAGTYLGIAGMFMCDRTASDDMLRACASMISQNTVGRLAEWGAAMYDYDERAALPVLGRVPCTVLAADHDRFIPEALTRQLAEGIPGSRLLTVPDSGHMIPIEHPEAVTGAVLQMVTAVTR